MKNTLKMSTVLGLLLFPVTGFAGETTKLKHETEVVNPLAPEEVGQLDFLIGDWLLHTKIQFSADEIRENTAELSVRYILGGGAIQMVAFHPPADTPGNTNPPFWATTILNYDVDNKKWTGASVNTLGNRKFVEGEFKDGVFTLVQSGKLFNNRPGSNRLTFYNITADSYDYRFEYKLQDWQDWNLGGYAYTAERKKPSTE